MMEKLTDNEMYLLLGRLTATLSPEEELQVEVLLREHPHAQAAYDELAATYATRTGEPEWSDISLVLRQRTKPRYLRDNRMTWRRWIAAVAIVVLLSASYFLWKQALDSNPASTRIATKPAIELRLSTGETIDLSTNKGNIAIGDTRFDNTDNALSYTTGQSVGAAGLHTLTVPVGLDYKITLADGTEVWLNSATRLDFPATFTGGKREIRIDGEAYLKVAKDTNRPFIVSLRSSQVAVVGTEFNVNTYDDGVEKVALFSGAVRMESYPAARVGLAAPGPGVSLKPGQQAIQTDGQPITVQPFNSRHVLSWRHGRYYFQEATLEEISRVVPRWYGIQVSIDDPEIRLRRFTGMIDRKQPIDIFLEDLNAISGIRGYVDSAGTLHFGQ